MGIRRASAACDPLGCARWQPQDGRGGALRGARRVAMGWRGACFRSSTENEEMRRLRAGRRGGKRGSLSPRLSARMRCPTSSPCLAGRDGATRAWRTAQARHGQGLYASRRRVCGVRTAGTAACRCQQDRIYTESEGAPPCLVCVYSWIRPWCARTNLCALTAELTRPAACSRDEGACQSRVPGCGGVCFGVILGIPI